MKNFAKFELKPDERGQESKDGLEDDKSEKDEDYNKENTK